MWRGRVLPLFVGAALLAGCGGSGGSKGPTAEVTAPSTAKPTTTVARTPEQQVEAAYLRSWDVFTKAARDLDAEGLNQSFAEAHLARLTDEIERLKRDGTAVRVLVEHGLHVEIVRPDLAIVRDHYRNHSVLIDRRSRAALEPDPNKVLVEVSTLKEVNGLWKVIDVVREPSSAP
jgi:hypothetical protein